MRKLHQTSHILGPWRYKTLRFGMVCLAFGVLTFFQEVSDSTACGIGWQRPVSHFDGVDEQGHTSYSEQIGELDLSEDLRLPLFVIFNSSWEASSPYLGKGWNLCLLESRIEQIDENTFKLVQPDGWCRMFGRKNTSETVMGGQGGWKAKVEGDRITAYADCGWKLTFDHGRIISMATPKGCKLDWVYENSQVSEVREGNATRLKVEYDMDGKVGALRLLGSESSRILLEQGKRPRVQVVSGQRVVTGVDSSLSSLILENGSKQLFVFGLDENVLPTLQVENQGKQDNAKSLNNGPARILGWDPQNRLALHDGAWTYQITAAHTAGGNAAIGRMNSNAQKEYWFYDGANGQEVTSSSDGVQRTKYWFMAGALAGKLRKIEETKDGQKRTSYQATYDEKGRIFRELNSDGSINQFKYNPDGDKLSKDHFVFGKKDYDIQYRHGYISTVRSADGSTLQYYYDEEGREIRMTIDGKVHSMKTYAPDNSWESEEVYDYGNERISRTFYQEYNKDKKLILDRITKRDDSSSEITKTIVYDKFGQVINCAVTHNNVAPH